MGAVDLVGRERDEVGIPRPDVDQPVRVVVATTDPATLPPLTTWYLATNLPRPGAPHADESPVSPADLVEIIVGQVMARRPQSDRGGRQCLPGEQQRRQQYR